MRGIILGTPETKRNGLKTLNARKALTSKPSGITLDNNALKILFFNYIPNVNISIDI